MEDEHACAHVGICGGFVFVDGGGSVAELNALGYEGHSRAGHFYFGVEFESAAILESDMCH